MATETKETFKNKITHFSNSICLIIHKSLFLIKKSYIIKLQNTYVYKSNESMLCMIMSFYVMLLKRLNNTIVYFLLYLLPQFSTQLYCIKMSTSIFCVHGIKE